MERRTYINAAPSLGITIACVWAFLAHKSFTFDSGSHFPDFLLYHFSHANIFHLAANLTAVLYFRPRIFTSLVAFACASLAASVPTMAMDLPTCGLSAFIFAAYARKYYFWRMPVYGLLLSIAITTIIPFLNWKIHLLSFLLSYIFWMAFDEARTRYRQLR